MGQHGPISLHPAQALHHQAVRPTRPSNNESPGTLNTITTRCLGFKGLGGCLREKAAQEIERAKKVPLGDLGDQGPKLKPQTNP